MNDTRQARRAAIFLLVGALGLSSSGCARTTVSRILAEPQRYTRQNDVGLRGDVVDIGTVMKLPEQIGSGLVMQENKHRAQ